MKSIVTKTRFHLTLMALLLAIGQGWSQGNYAVTGPFVNSTPGTPLLRTVDNSVTTGGTTVHLYNACGSASTNCWSAPVPLPFTFYFYGVPFNAICVSKNYLATFDTTVAGQTLNTTLNINTALPEANLPNYSIAYMWGDFIPPQGSNDDVWVFTYGTAPNRQFWVMNYSFKVDALSYSYNYLVLEETTNKIYVVDARNSAANTGTFTIGIQQNATTATQVSGSPNIPTINANNITNPAINQYYQFDYQISVGLDAGILSIDEPASPSTPGTNNVSVTVRNFGTTDLTSLNIYYSVDGAPAGTPYPWAGLLPAGSNYGPVLLGTTSLALGTHTVKAWTGNPNNQPDQNPQNDTLHKNILTCNVMNGGYVIGGLTPDYPTFNDAVSALLNCGISGPVTFFVENGVYNEHITIPAIQGASATNTITFESTSLDSTAAVLTFAGTGTADNWTVLLDGAQHITFSHLTIANTGATYGRAIELKNGASNNIFTGNIIQSIGTSSTASGIYSSTTAENNTLIENNLIDGGYYGIYLRGVSSTSQETGNIIRNNVVRNFFYYGINAGYQLALEATGNTVESSLQAAAVYGMYIYYCDSAIRILKNKVLVTGSGSNYGLYVYYCDASSANPGLVANNFVTQNSASTGTIYGLCPYYSTHQLIYNNSVNILSPSTTGRACYVTGGGNIHLINNMFVNAGGGYAIYAGSTTSIVESNYNNFYTTGGSLAYYSSAISNLAGWQSATGFDPNSQSADPGFMTPTFLYPSNTTVNNTGTPLAEVPDDIFGTPRDPMTPDIGAVEFDVVADDAGVVAIDHPVQPATIGSNDVLVTIKNFGQANLGFVNIDYSVDGIQGTTYFWMGNLPSGATEGPILLGSTNLSAGFHTIKSWTSLPNGVTDGVPLNDTTQVTINACNAFSGVYYIGGPTPDYATFNDAITALASCGISGPVQFLVADGIYEEQVTIPAIAGTDSVNTITFESYTGDSTSVVLTHNANGTTDNWTLRFDGAEYINFRKMTIIAADTTYARVIELINEASHITIQGNIIRTVSTVSTSAGIYSSTTVENYVTIDDNLIDGSYYGIYLRGGSSSVNEKGTRITNNKVTNFFYYGIYPGYQEAIEITGNQVTSSPLAATSYGMYVYYCDSAIRVLKNKVLVTASGSNYAFYIYYCEANAAHPGLVANNFVTQNSSSTGTIYGLTPYYSKFLHVYNNSVNILSPSTTGRACYVTGGNDISLINNIFSNPGGGYAIYAGSTTAITNSNYNNFYTTGSSLGYFSSAQPNLQAWQTASGYDPNSVSIDPMYMTPDFLYPSNVSMNNLGTPLSEVTDDIFGTPRDPVTPDMGAVEFDIIYDDAGVVAFNDPGNPAVIGLNDIKVTIRNFGLNTLTSVNLDYSVDGITGSTFPWTGSLASGATEGPLYLGTVSLTGGLHTLKAWTSMPNGLTDPLPLNDTLEVVLNACDAMNGTYSIGGAASDYATFGDAIAAMMNCGIAGPVQFLVADGVYTEQVTIPDIPGTDSVNTITFESLSGDSTLVTLTFGPTGSANNWTLRLNEAKHIVIRKMTLASTGTTYARVIELINGASGNTISNNVIYSTSTSSTSAGIYSSTTKENNTLIENNLIDGGYYGIYLRGASSTSLETGNVIRGNIVKNFYYYGVYPGYQDAVEVTDNYIESSASAATSYGLYVYYCDNGIRILKNRLNIRATGSNYCMYIYYCDGTVADTGLVANNFVTQNSTSTGTIYGLCPYSSNYLRVYNNSVNILSTSTSGRACYIYNTSSLLLEDNVFVNSGGGYAIYASSVNAGCHSDYNNLFTTGASLGYFSSAKADLAAWQLATGMDSNSVSTDPMFFSSTNLTPSSFLMNNLGLPLPEITDDIFGNPRDPLTPDMGAAEFEPAAAAAELMEITAPVGGCNLGSEPVSIRIMNMGANTITNGLTAGYMLENDTNIVTETVNTSILPGDTLDFTFSTPVNLSTQSDTTYHMTAFIHLVNDPNLLNDTLHTSLFSALSPPAPQVSGQTVNYAMPATLQVVQPDTSLIYSWFDVPSGGTPVGQGITFTTPPLTATTTYYVQSENGYSVYVGAPDNTIGAGGYVNYATYAEVFDVLSPGGITISTMDIYFRDAGVAYTINVENSSGTVVDSYSGTTTVGQPAAETVPVDLQVPFGTGYEVRFSVCPYVYRNTAGATYPYTVPGSISITGNTFSGYPQYFYYFYHWKIGTSNGCPSTRVPDTAYVILPDILVNIQASDTLICSGDTVNLNAQMLFGAPPFTFAWSPAAGLSNPTAQAPYAVPMTTTTYSVTATDNNGDTSTDAIIITVLPSPNVVLPPYSNVCVYWPAFPLNTGTPAGGNYSGPGVSLGMFNPSVAGVGTHLITYTVTPANGCTRSASQPIVVDACVGTEDFSFSSTLLVTPNPGTGEFTLTAGGMDGNTELTILDPQGRLVWSRTVTDPGQNGLSEKIDMTAQPRGVYYLKALNSKGMIVRKILLQ